MYEIQQSTWTTPRGNRASFRYRADTADWNTIQASTTEDEYRLRELDLSGWALDIGGYVGSVSIALALDNPNLSVICVEAVPANQTLIQENIDLNGLGDRVTLVKGAAGDGRKVAVKWGYEGDEVATHHAFVGNANNLGESTSQRLEVVSLTLADLIGDKQIAFCKIDCEGCEYAVLQGDALAQIERIHGEIHGIADCLPASLPANLLATHTYERGGELPTWFEAVRR